MNACCEEMKVLLEAMRKNAFKKDEVYQNGSVQFFEDGESELAVLNVFNIIFRFCPYCGAPVGEKEPDTSNPVVKRLSDLIFNKEIDDAQTISARTVVLDETIVELRKLLKAGAALL